MLQMWYSFVAIGLMFLINILVVYARKQQNRWLRLTLSTFAFLLLFPTLFLIIIVVFPAN